MADRFQWPLSIYELFVFFGHMLRCWYRLSQTLLGVRFY